MRITNTTIARNYTSNLNRNLQRLNDANMGVYTGRKFKAMAEDTSSGVRAMAVRRNLSQIESYLDNANGTKQKFDSAEKILGQISGMGITVSERLTYAINGTTGPEERDIIANELEHIRNEILSCANSQYADRSLYGGTNTQSRPFSLDGDGRLVYNGVKVADISKGDPQYDYLFNDEGYIDIGMGLTMQGNSQQVVENSVFRNTINGLDVMGYGSTNMYDTITDIIDVLREPSLDRDKAGALLDQIMLCNNNVNIQRTRIGSDSQHLEYSISRLETDQLNLTERQDTLEFRDAAEAITDFTMQQYVYNAALQMGSKILQPTIFSFIN